MSFSPGQARGILAFWFEETGSDQWYGGGAALDKAIAGRYAELWEAQRGQSTEAFLVDADSALAATILFDQFPRNMFRGQADAFATDPLARAIADGAIARGFDRKMNDERRQFFYLPFMHSEDIVDQERCVGLTRNLPNTHDYAIAHRDMIARFGRFPHRNAALGRESTKAECKALEEGAGW